MKAYLNNGKQYHGSVYVMSGFPDAEEKGWLNAFCYGHTWGINCGTCLTGLFDEDGNRINMIEHSGKSGMIDKNGNLTFAFR